MAQKKRRGTSGSPPAGGRLRRHAVSIAVVAVLLGTAVAALAFIVRGERNRPATAAEIKELLVVTTKGTALSSAATQAMLGQLSANGTAVDPKAVRIIPAEVDAFFADAMARPGGLGDAMVPVFAERFTSGEIADLLAFYRSPLGRKLSDEMPLIAGKTALLAQQWTL